MYKKILACIDGSFNAEAAAKYAINIAKACKAEIHVVCVIEKGVHQNTVRISFERLAQMAEKDNIPFHTHFLYGDVVSQILHLVKKESIELVLSSVRRVDWQGRFFVKSLPQKLMLVLPCSVIAVRVVGYRGSVKRILVPLRSWKYYFYERLYLLSFFALTFSTELVIFRVQEIPQNKAIFSSKEILRLKKIGEKEIVFFTEGLAELGVNVKSKVKISTNLPRAILFEAARGRYDLIFMGAYQRDIVKRAIEGNLVEEVLRNTPCDMMIWYPKTRRLRPFWQKIFKIFKF